MKYGDLERIAEAADNGNYSRVIETVGSYRCRYHPDFQGRFIVFHHSSPENREVEAATALCQVCMDRLLRKEPRLDYVSAEDFSLVINRINSILRGSRVRGTVYE